MDSVVTSKDSVKNCTTKEPRRAPTVFLMPTSLARRDARAVVRLMKLMQAMPMMNMAINEKSFT